MSSQFPVLLAWTFLGSLVLGALRTSRWIAVCISVIAVWVASLEQSAIDRLWTGTVENYAWFALLSAAVWIPTGAASIIGADIGTQLLNLLPSTEAEAASEAEPEQSEEQPG